MTTVIHKSKGLTQELKAQLEAIAAMPDESIDTSDMPEVTDWSGWTRGKLFRPVKRQVTLRLDADLIDWFKTHGNPGQSGTRGYQTRINAALRKVVEGERQKA